MSYCRFGVDSDVYMYESTDGVIVCCGCLLSEDCLSVEFSKRSEALKHLQEHVDKKWIVPQEAIDRLTTDMVRDGDEV